MNITNVILIGGKFSTDLHNTINKWNDKLNSFTSANLDSPWAGMAIFIILMVFGFAAIKMFSKK